MNELILATDIKQSELLTKVPAPKFLIDIGDARRVEILQGRRTSQIIKPNTSQ